MSEQNQSRQNLTLDEFPPHRYEDWKAAAIALLKGASFEKKLYTDTPEKILLEPLYRREDIEHLKPGMPGMDNRLRSSRISGNADRSWAVSQEARIPDPRLCNDLLVDALERGQTEVRLVLDSHSRQGRPLATRNNQDPDGLILLNLADLELALQGINLQKTPVIIDAGFSWPGALALLLGIQKKQKLPLTAIHGGVPVDPLTQLAVTGNVPGGLQKQYDLLADWINCLHSNAPEFVLLESSAAPVHDAGGSAVEELSWLAASLAETLRKLDQRGIAPTVSLAHMQLEMATGGSFFMEIAKFRAARQLFSMITRAFGVNDAPVHLHARSGRWNLSRLDPHVNLLRTTTGAFAAIAGGCDSLHVIPFDEVNGPAENLSSRLARNIQLILRDECELKRVIDPAGGSYTVEVLTDQLARGSWKAFQQIESEGGLEAALKKGTVQDIISHVAENRRHRLALRTDVMVGCNMYPIADEKILPPAATISTEYRQQLEEQISSTASNENPVLNPSDAIAAALSGVSLNSLLPDCEAPADTISPLPTGRAIQAFEELRQTSSTADAPLHVFQANLGPSRSYRARADWTTGFFQVGGFHVSADRDFNTPEEAVTAALESGAAVVILTGSDDVYPDAVPIAARLLKKAPTPPRVLVAGTPGDHEANWRNAGVDDFIHARVNCLESLQQLLHLTGGCK